MPDTAPEISIEQSPLRTTFVRSHSRFALSRPHPACLVIKYHRGVRLFAWCCSVAGWIVLPLGLLGLLNHPAAMLLVMWGGVMLFMGVWLLGPRYRFDTGAAELTVRHFWRTRRRPLADIVAVQVIAAGRFQSGARSYSGPQKDHTFSSYQMNLILDDPSERRLFVTYNEDLADMGKKAGLLADFLQVPLLAATKVIDTGQATKSQNDGRQDSALPTGGRSDPTRHWAKTDERLPAFDLGAGALDGLTLGDNLEQAEFLGRPDRVEHLEHPGEMRLHYVQRGFRLGFMPQFVELTCHIAPPSDVPPERGQGFSRPRLSGGIELTPETSVARVRDLFGPPKSEHDSPRDKTLTYCYLRGRFYMEFEFEQSTGRLLTWSVPV